MIRFSAFLVVVAVGTLVAGVVTSKLLLVYIAIGVSGLALLALGAGAAVHWRELTGKPETATARAGAQAPATSLPPAVVPQQVATPEPATAAAASAATGVASTATATAASRPPWSGTLPAGSSRPEYLPPAATRPPAPSEWKWRDEPAPRETAAEKPAASLAGQRDRAVADDQPSAPDDDRSVQDQTMIFRAQPDQTMIFRAQPAAVAEKHAARTPGEPGARTSAEPAARTPAEPAPAAHAPVSDVTAAPENTATAADTARESTAQESESTAAESTAAESTAAESAPPAGDPEPAADTPAAASGPAPASGSASEDDAPSKTDGQADPAPATEPEPAGDIAPAGNAAPSEDAPSEDEPTDEATTITKAVAPASGAESDLEVTEVTVVPGVPRYHRASCILIRFMGDSDLDKMTVAAAKEAGCTPCRACLPDQPEESPE